jgi:hypothetical protein
VVVVCVVCCVWSGEWYVFGGKMVVACKSAFFHILDLIWYLPLKS